MSNAIIKIKNCNNIVSGELSIYSNKLNILYGRNGTGKSTIAHAIYLASNGKDLTELAPYGNKETAVPSIECIPTGGIAIFDERYVDQYIYQPDSLIKDAFEVLIRSNEYDEAKSKIDNALANIRSTITERQTIIELRNQIGISINTIKFSSTNKIVKRGGAKGVLEGKGAYFNHPEELGDLKPFLRIFQFRSGQHGACKFMSNMEIKGDVHIVLLVILQKPYPLIRFLRTVLIKPVLKQHLQ